MCFYDMSLWKYYKVGFMNKLAAAYIKSIKIFFGYAKFSSDTVILSRHTGEQSRDASGRAGPCRAVGCSQ